MRKIPEYLFLCDDGNLYDTRDNGWSIKPPLRRNYAGGVRDIKSFADVKRCLRGTGFTFGYKPYFTGDGFALCDDCVKANLSLICDSMTHGDSRDQWRLIGRALTTPDDYLPPSEGGGIPCDNCGDWIAEPEDMAGV